MRCTVRGPILAIDTATRYVGLALYDGQYVLSESCWRTEQRHTSTLMPNLIRTLDDQGFGVAQLGGLAVALGPGSYTGLRIGLAVAKGLALSCNIPLIGVPTFDALAYSCGSVLLCTSAPPSLRVYLEAGRGRFCAANFRLSGGQIRSVGEYEIVARDELGADWSSETDGRSLVLVCGELDAESEKVLRARLGNRMFVASPAARLRRPGYLAELAWARLSEGKQDDPATLSPVYLRAT